MRSLADLGPPLAAYLGGSRAFGLGNALSDVDLTVVYDDAALTDDVQRERSVPGRDVSLHCEVRAFSEVAPLRDLYARPELPYDAASVTAEAVVSTHRRLTELLRGPVVVTSPAFEALRSGIDPKTVDHLSSRAAATICALSVRDAAGAAVSGDWLTAATAAEIALEYALDAALFAAGDPYRSRKFLARRLSRHEHLAGHVTDWRRLAAVADDERRARETLLLANGVAAATLLGTGPVWTTGTDGGGPRRSPYASLVATDADLRLAGAIEAALPRPVAIVWLLADGRDTDALAARFAELHGLRQAEVEGFVRNAVASLAGAGALQP